MNVYVGPFFLVDEKSFVQRLQIRRCSNIVVCGRVQKGPGGFCPHCGHPVSVQWSDATVHREPTPADLDGSWVDRMVVSQDTKGQTVWFPDKAEYGTYFSSYEPEPLLVIDLASMRLKTEKFLQEHRDIFDAYRKKFNIELVDAFGAVPYR
jgi:hypothetical protein